MPGSPACNLFNSGAMNFRRLLKKEEMKSIEFNYKGKTYYALIRTTNFETHCHHYTTIMNGKLEAIFFGHHIFIEENGKLRSANNTTDAQVNELKKCIQDALYRQIVSETYYVNNENVENYSRTEQQKAVA